jgi:hypothetical protein
MIAWPMSESSLPPANPDPRQIVHWFGKSAHFGSMFPAHAGMNLVTNLVHSAGAERSPRMRG